MRQGLIILLTCATLTSAFGQVERDTVFNSKTKELSLKAALVIPAYYNLNFFSKNVTPDFKLSYVFGFQYKNKRNVLFDLQFQHYNFNYRTPNYYISNGLKFSNQSYAYYDILNYGQYRVSIGIGRHKKMNSKNTIGFVLGATLFIFDQGIFYTSTYSSSGILTSIAVDKSYGAKLASYINVGYSYRLNKRFFLTTDLNYCLIYYSGGNGWDYYDLSSESFLSINVGVKFNLVNKVTN